jgi:DNA-binding transcriptional LysR family regulator
MTGLTVIADRDDLRPCWTRACADRSSPSPRRAASPRPRAGSASASRPSASTSGGWTRRRRALFARDTHTVELTACQTSSLTGLRAAAAAGLGVTLHARSLVPADLVERAGRPEPGDIGFMLLAREPREEPAAALAEFVLDRVGR